MAGRDGRPSKSILIYFESTILEAEVPSNNELSLVEAGVVDDVFRNMAFRPRNECIGRKIVVHGCRTRS